MQKKKFPTNRGVQRPIREVGAADNMPLFLPIHFQFVRNIMRSSYRLTLPLLLALAAPLCHASEVKISPAHQKTLESLRKEGGLRITHVYGGSPNANEYAPARPAQLQGKGNAKISRILARARQLIGIPYRLGGDTLETGFDCSGLLVYLYRTEAGMQLPRTTGDMIRSDDAERVRRSELKPGDFVFFNRNGRGTTSHVGLYIGNNQFIHAPRTGQSIRKDSLDEDYWQRSYITARRFQG